MRKVPCEHCENRTEDCHGKCEKYKEFSELIEKDREKRQANTVFVSYKADARLRAIKKELHRKRR